MQRRSRINKRMSRRNKSIKRSRSSRKSKTNKRTKSYRTKRVKKQLRFGGAYTFDNNCRVGGLPEVVNVSECPKAGPLDSCYLKEMYGQSCKSLQSGGGKKNKRNKKRKNRKYYK